MTAVSYHPCPCGSPFQVDGDTCPSCSKPEGDSMSGVVSVSGIASVSDVVIGAAIRLCGALYNGEAVADEDFHAVDDWARAVRWERSQPALLPPLTASGGVCTCGNPGPSAFIDTMPGAHHAPPCPLARSAFDDKRATAAMREALTCNVTVSLEFAEHALLNQQFDRALSFVEDAQRECQRLLRASA